LTVRHAAGGERSDLELLRGQAIAEIGRAPRNLLSGSAQLLSRSPAPRGGAQRIEESHAFPQWRPRFGAPPSPSQPAAKRKQCPGSKKRIAGEVLGERGAEQRLRLVLPRHERPGAPEAAAENRSLRTPGNRLS